MAMSSRFVSIFPRSTPKSNIVLVRFFYSSLSKSSLSTNFLTPSSINYPFICSSINLNRFCSNGNIVTTSESEGVPGLQIIDDKALVEVTGKYREIDIPRHPEALTEQHVDHAIEVYQEEYKRITCKFVEVAYELPKDAKDMYDDSDWQKWFYKKRRFRFSEILKSALINQKRREIINQAFNPRRTGILGPDLAAAHFITYRGGKVKFVGSNKWVSTDIGLPQTMDAAFKVEKFDGSSCKLHYEGLDNLINLKHLEHLDLSDNPLDDWACGRLSCHFRNSTKLKYLDLTENINITSIGLQSLVSISSLEKIVITGTSAANYPHLKLLILLMQDVNPRLTVEV